MKIPTKQDWGDFKDNPDVKYGYKLFGGKSIEEVSDLFIDFPIERASELRYAPFNIFKYYVHCFINFLTSEKSATESDVASNFLRLVRDMSKKYPNEFANFYPEIENAVAYVADNQTFYDADYNIYGSFEYIRQEIEKNIDNA